jgi:ribonuclease PH
MESCKLIRVDGREPNQMRDVKITANVQEFAEGSALIEMGKTKVLGTATLENKVPPYVMGTGS